MALEHSVTGGQSLAGGSSGTPGYSLTQEYANALLVSTVDGTTSPLKIAATTNPQRPDLSMGYRIAQANPSLQIGMSTHSMGAQAISALMKGGSSGKYEEFIATAIKARDAELALSGSYHARAYHWIQGEQDQVGSTSQATYITRLIAMLADIQTDWKAISGQADVIPFIMSQTASWAYYGTEPKIGLAQLTAARTLPNVYIVGGQYQLTYVEGLHLKRDGYYKLGELHGRAHNAVKAGLGWPPFAPILVTRSSTDIKLKFYVPHGPLAFDTAVVAAQPNMGFSLLNTAAVITSATISASDEVTLQLSQPITEPGSRVGYGVAYGTGPGLGNLRDSEPALSVYDGQQLANWALHFSEDLGIATPPPSKLWIASKAFLIGANSSLHGLAFQP